MSKSTSSKSKGEAYEIFGRRVNKLRDEYGYSQSQVAELIGIPTSTYACYETGLRKIPLTLLKKLAYLFKTSVDYLIGYDGEEELNDMTVAAHHNGDTWSEEELEYINLTKKILMAKRKKSGE